MRRARRGCREARGAGRRGAVGAETLTDRVGHGASRGAGRWLTVPAAITAKVTEDDHKRRRLAVRSAIRCSSTSCPAPAHHVTSPTGGAGPARADRRRRQPPGPCADPTQALHALMEWKCDAMYDDWYDVDRLYRQVGAPRVPRGPGAAASQRDEPGVGLITTATLLCEVDGVSEHDRPTDHGRRRRRFRPADVARVPRGHRVRRDTHRGDLEGNQGRATALRPAALSEATSRPGSARMSDVDGRAARSSRPCDGSIHGIAPWDHCCRVCQRRSRPRPSSMCGHGPARVDVALVE